jgi:hypothetical protein
MLFLHGMQSRYGDTSPTQVEADARRYAGARGYDLEAIDISGDNRVAQLKEARSRLREGGYSGVVGFSAGGATADQLRNEFPDLDITSVSTGADGRGGTYFPGVPHMGQMGALANQAEEKNRQHRHQGRRRFERRSAAKTGAALCLGHPKNKTGSAENLRPVGRLHGTAADALADDSVVAYGLGRKNSSRTWRSVASHASRRIPITAMTTAVATCHP